MKYQLAGRGWASAHSTFLPGCLQNCPSRAQGRVGNDVKSLRAELDRVKSCLSCWVSLLPARNVCAEIAEGLALDKWGSCMNSSPWSLGLGVGQSLC